MNDHIDTSQWQRLGVLFEQAIGLDTAGQTELLRSIERTDPKLGQALVSLLAADAMHEARTVEQRERVLQSSLDAIEKSDVDIGDRVGPYVLRESLGRGGMGAVFLADRADGQVRQEVAVKVIKLGMDTREVIARFEAERQALALMEHPHIARMLDAGATDSGRPYFVMELVRGEPISSYCSKHDLTIVQRLQLFDQVCAAVQHAHTKGIIHRDLKPTNVLVSTEDGQPFAKVIDFGIAKATSGRLTDKTLLTEQYLMIGTALYMSPEQAAGSADIDTRTDIYALGVILYELLTDTTPIDSNSLRKAVREEVQRIIREIDPPRPSVRLSQSATARPGATAEQGIDHRALVRIVRGELDWIVMKAIEKDRTRRYETASAFAMDVRRYLAGEAVLAAPPGAAYRLRKLILRNKGAVAAGSMIAAALLAGILAFAWQARIARQQASLAQEQARLAQQRAREVERVATFEGDMLKQVDPNRAGKELMDDIQAKLAAALVKAGMSEKERAGQVAVFADLLRRVNATDTAVGLIDRTTMKPAVAAIDEQFKDQPAVAARLQQVLADRYALMGLFDAAMPLQMSALATRRRVLGEEDRDTLQSLEKLGGLIMATQSSSKAEPYIRELLQKRRRALGREDPDTLEAMGDLGQILLNEGKTREAEPLVRQALAASRRVNGEETKATLDLVGLMGYLLWDEGKPEDAERYYREAIQKSSRVLGRDHPHTLELIGTLGNVLWEEGRLDEAERYFRESMEGSRRVLGEEHAETVLKIGQMGSFLLAMGRLSEAERYLRESMEEGRRVWGGEDRELLQTTIDLGRSLAEQGKFRESEPYLSAALDASRRALGEEDSTTLTAIVDMGDLLQDEGKLDEAEASFREALEKSRHAPGSDDSDTQSALAHLGALLVARNRLAEAEKLLAPVEAADRSTPSGRSASFGMALMSLGMARARLAKFDAAETDLLEAQPILVRLGGPKGKLTRKCTQALIDLYKAWNAAQPGRGYDAKSAEWKRKLDAMDAPAPAATAH